MCYQCNAFIFDLDGTLVDSAAIVERVMRHWCRENEIDYALVKDSSRSSRTEDTVRCVAPHLSCTLEAEKIEAIERDELASIGEIAGASDFLDLVPSHLWGLATSSDSATAKAKLVAAGLPVPSTLIGGDQVENGKPHPEAYTRAAASLGFSPRDCLAFEDSDTGIGSALAAGCSVFVIGADLPQAEPRIIGAARDFRHLKLHVEAQSSLKLEYPDNAEQVVDDQSPTHRGIDA